MKFPSINGLNGVVSNVYVGTDGKLHKVQGGADSVLPFNKTPSFGEETKYTTYARLNSGGDFFYITFSHNIIGIKNISWYGGSLGAYAQPVVDYSISGNTVAISVQKSGDYGTFTNAYTISVTIIYLNN